ncbi:MAG: RidA family protein [Myxococcota bacterium]
MPHHVIETAAAPAAIGPYSQAVQVGGTTWCSGQIPLDPETGDVVGEGDVAAQTRQVMKNLFAVVAAAGHGVEDIVKTTIYVTDMGDFATVNEAYEQALAGHRPARATVQVGALPKGVDVEIDAVAVKTG